ncbi:transposase [Aeoliella mucimassa]|nr:transposase [Aeoliella mucimassa]
MEKEPIQFREFDPAGDIQYAERKLPHWFQPGVAMFVTFRTKDSMPRAVVDRWQFELDAWVREQGLGDSATIATSHVEQWPRAIQSEYRRLRNRLWQFALDKCHGECVLRRPELASIVSQSLLYFNGERYDVDCFVVMPNHVHLLVQFHGGWSLAKQSESWLRFSGGQINQQLGRRGAFWQAEPFDHLVRSAEQFEFFRCYIAENPQKANLKPSEYVLWTQTRK